MPQHPMSILHSAWAQMAEEGQRTAWYEENDHVFPKGPKLECHSNSGTQLHLRRRITWDAIKEAQYLAPSLLSWVPHTGSSSRKMGTWGQEDMILIPQELKISREEETNSKVTTSRTWWRAIKETILAPWTCDPGWPVSSAPRPNVHPVPLFQLFLNSV